jgi:hypothetical protein
MTAVNELDVPGAPKGWAGRLRAAERCTLRAGPTRASRPVGLLAVGELVTVTAARTEDGVARVLLRARGWASLHGNGKQLLAFVIGPVAEVVEPAASNPTTPVESPVTGQAGPLPVANRFGLITENSRAVQAGAPQTGGSRGF